MNFSEITSLIADILDLLTGKGPLRLSGCRHRWSR